jgi:hypothetical protein
MLIRKQGMTPAFINPEPTTCHQAHSYTYENPISLLMSAYLLLSMLAVRAADELEGRAVLPAATFAQGPTSGQQLGTDTINGQPVPFLKQATSTGFFRRSG